MAEDYYAKQCKLEKPSTIHPGGTSVLTAWINEKYAKLGNRIELKDEEGDKKGPWTVVQVGSRKHISYLREYQANSERGRFKFLDDHLKDK